MICPKSLPLFRSRLRRVCRTLVVVSLGIAAAHGAKNPDKPEKPDKFDKPVRVDKIERKLEQAAMAEFAEPAAARPIVAASSNDRSGKSDRSSKSDRSDSTNIRAAASLPADPKFDAFRVIQERNIFNPNRAPRSRTTPEEKPPRPDEIVLVGTMQYEKGLIAFFDSADSEYRKNLREGEAIAGFQLRKIAADGVELSRGEERITLKVAQQLRRPEGGDWSVNSNPPARGETRTTSSPDDARSAAAAAATEIPADASEVLKRLMKQREKLSK